MQFKEKSKARDNNRIRIMRFAEKNGIKSYESKIYNHMIIEKIIKNNRIAYYLVKNIKEIKFIIGDK